MDCFSAKHILTQEQVILYFIHEISPILPAPGGNVLQCVLLFDCLPVLMITTTVNKQNLSEIFILVGPDQKRSYYTLGNIWIIFWIQKSQVFKVFLWLWLSG